MFRFFSFLSSFLAFLLSLFFCFFVRSFIISSFPSNDFSTTFNSVSTLLWFNDCDDLNIDGYNYGDISPYTGPEGSGGYLLRMSKNGDNYWFPFEGPAIDFSDLELGPIPIYKSGFLRPRTRERNLDTNRWEWNYDNESAGTYISIGIITIAAPL